MNNQSNLVKFKPIKIHHTAYKWHFLWNKNNETYLIRNVYIADISGMNKE